MKNILLCVFFSLIISGCKIQAEEKQDMLPDKQTMETHCIGRHRLTIPDTFVASDVTTATFKTVDLGPQDPSFDVVVRAVASTQAQFSLEVAKRRAELKRGGSDTTDLLKLEKELGKDATLFRVQVIDDAYVSEINLLRGASVVRVRLESYENKYLLAEENLVKFAASIKADSIERFNGFCLGPVIVTGDFQAESGSYLFRNGAGADFDINVDTYAQDASDTLLQRMSGPSSLLRVFDVRHSVLRSGERTVAGMKAQEWLGWARITEEQDVRTLKFRLETMRMKPTKAAPRITVTFDTAQPLGNGTPTKTMFSNEGAIELWDSVISSIRPVET